MKANELRRAFLEFFQGKGHVIHPSHSLVPDDDPTLLFTVAGMSQFKDYFLGKGELPFRRATTSQKCLRTNDLEVVGKTSFHHTFFEMLGNFSFGDYFKEEAITWGWEFLTARLGLPAERLEVSVYRDDDEAFRIWKEKVGVPEFKIHRLGPRDNFWPANAPVEGPNGPCGPCSEIFYDHGPEFACGAPECGVACDCDRYVEIWNLVFLQFERRGGGELVPLPQKNIDTGMGFERMLAVLNGQKSNFDTELFLPQLAWLAAASGKEAKPRTSEGVRMRRVADHSRAMAFVIADGVLPGNEGRNYVLRKIIRRAVRDGRELGIARPFLKELIPITIEQMSGTYPELAAHREKILEVVHHEEEKFGVTLDQGMRLLEAELEEMGRRGERVLPGKSAFFLHDRHGFPVDLVESVLSERGLELDRAGYEASMEEQRRASAGGGEAEVFDTGPLARIRSLVPKVNFLGYEGVTAEAGVKVLVQGDNVVEQAVAGEETVIVVTDATPFYPEGGGQVGDRGTIRGEHGEVRVEETKKSGEVIVHLGKLVRGTLQRGETVWLTVSARRRRQVEANHSATHLLHAALRETLGTHVEQMGSLVTDKFLRFDFRHFAPLSPAEIDKVEALVQERIEENLPVATAETTLEKARTAGAMALFGEKYGSAVRLVTMGDFSRELCGGTHVVATGAIGTFRLVNESSIAAGIRRVEAQTGVAALRLAQEDRALLADLGGALKAPRNDLRRRAQELQDRVKRLEAETEKGRRGQLQETAAGLAATGEAWEEGITWFAWTGKGQGADDLRRMSDELRKRSPAAVAVLSSIPEGAEGKVLLVAAAGPEAVSRGAHAGDLAKVMARVLGGGGGGKPDFAQAGGRDTSRWPEALEQARMELKRQLAAKPA